MGASPFGGMPGGVCREQVQYGGYKQIHWRSIRIPNDLHCFRHSERAGFAGRVRPAKCDQGWTTPKDINRRGASWLPVVRENDIGRKELKNQRHPELGKARHVTLLYDPSCGPRRFSVGTRHRLVARFINVASPLRPRS